MNWAGDSINKTIKMQAFLRVKLQITTTPAILSTNLPENIAPTTWLRIIQQIQVVKCSRFNRPVCRVKLMARHTRFHTTYSNGGCCCHWSQLLAGNLRWNISTFKHLTESAEQCLPTGKTPPLHFTSFIQQPINVCLSVS